MSGWIEGLDGVYDDDDCKKVADDVRAGNTEAVLAAKAIVDDHRKRNWPLPPSLSDLVAELFQKMADGERLPKCKHQVSNASRDFFITYIVHMIAEHFPGYPPTRAPERNGVLKPSASWVVSETLELLGIKLSQGRVEGIYSANIEKVRRILETKRHVDLGAFL